MPQDAKECQQFLGCEALFLVLSQLTGLKLHPWMPQDSDDDDEEDSAGVLALFAVIINVVCVDIIIIAVITLSNNILQHLIVSICIKT